MAEHIPVMADRVVELLAPALSGPDAVYVDCTLGLGGHARLVLDAFPGVRCVGIDRGFGDRVTLVQAVYDELSDVLADVGHPSVQGILADLGLSSLQIDTRERGFAYAVDAPLDMRMSVGEGPTAADVVNTYPAPAGSPGPSSGPGPRGPSPRRPASWRCSARRSRPPPATQAGTRPSAPSRRCASR